MKSLLSLGLCLAALLPLRAAEPFRFQENDLVVFLGDTWVEREQRDGAIETALLMSGGVGELRFRNLGWSGDTVRCDARGYFGGPAEGFDRLTASLSELHPTVVFLSYGGDVDAAERLIKLERELAAATAALKTHDDAAAAKKRRQKEYYEAHKKTTANAVCG